jgi:hypothetical protein
VDKVSEKKNNAKAIDKFSILVQVPGFKNNYNPSNPQQQGCNASVFGK